MKPWITTLIMWRSGRRRLDRVPKKRRDRAFRDGRLSCGLKTDRSLRCTDAARPPPAAVLAVRRDRTLETGPRRFFDTMRTYWGEVMCRDPLEQIPLDRWLEEHPREWQPVTPGEVQVLQKALRTVLLGKAAGMDNWPPEAVKPFPAHLVGALGDLFKWCEGVAAWPTAWTRVRTQLCPRDDRPEKQLGDFRPIAILSVWFRVWSRWRLLMTDPGVLDSFPEELCGGLPGRTLQGRMMAFMLRIEQLIYERAKGGKQQLLFVSLDASKCFDRVLQHAALDEALRFGLPLEALRDIGGHMRSLVRHLSCAGALDPSPIVPTTGLLQRDPYSVVLCNVVVMTWVRAMREREQPRVYGIHRW